MNDFLKMDIFFVVTTLAVVLVTTLIALVLIRIIRILSNVEDISKMVEEEGKLLRSDIADARANVRAEGFKVKHVAQFFRKRVERMFGKGK